MMANEGNCPASHRGSALPQWQPATTARLGNFRRQLLDWYAEHGRIFPWRRPRATRYQQILAELLLQRTRAEVVGEFLPRFLKRFPSWSAIAGASEDELGRILQPLGLWRRRAVSLRRLAVEMAARRGRFPSNRSEVEELPGVGQYVANAVMLFCHGVCEPLLDVNMARVLERYFGPRKLADIRYDPYLQELARRILAGERAAELNWAILDLAAVVCTIRNPRCPGCPLAAGCLHGRRVLAEIAHGADGDRVKNVKIRRS